MDQELAEGHQGVANSSETKKSLNSSRIYKFRPSQCLDLWQPLPLYDLSLGHGRWKRFHHGVKRRILVEETAYIKEISAILDAYSMIEHLDGSTQQPRQFLIDEASVQSVNPAFLIWKKKDKALLTLIYSTLSSPVLAMVIGSTTSQEVWNRLEEKFTCTARANVLNLKLELQGIKKGNESISSYLQKIKCTRDRLSAVGVHVDNEELLHMILKGLPKEFAPFASAIRTRDDTISFEKLSVLLQTEEQSMTEASDPFSNSALAMFVTNNQKPHTGFNGGFNSNQGYNRGRGGRNSSNRGRGGRSFGSYPTPSQMPHTSNSQPPSQFGSQGRPERPTCQICWKASHYAIDCYHRMDFAYQGKNPPTKLAAMASASNLQHTQNSETWLTDTGASDHITANASNLNTPTPYQGSDQVTVGNGQSLPIQSIVHKLCLDNNCSCHFDAKQLLIQDLPTGRLLYKGLSKDGVYPIHSSQFCRSASVNKSACLASSTLKWQLWHSRLGHPSAKVLHNILPSLSPCTSLDFNSVPTHCKHCIAGKMHQLPFPVSINKVTAPFQLVHADLWGPAPNVSINAFRFYLVLVDEFTKFTWVYLLKHKSDTFSIFKQFTALVKTQFQHSIQTFRTDCGGEFTSNEFHTFCANNGIVHQLSCPHTPQQNGVAERKHRHIIQCALALLSQSNLPISYWSYAVSTATHLINKLPTPILSNKSPWELLFKSKPSISHLKAFGCQCFPLLTPYNSHKLQPKSVPCIFVGYPSTSKGYICFDPSSHRFYSSRHVLFNETVFPGLTTSVQSSSSLQTSTFSPESWLNTLITLHCCSQSHSLASLGNTTTLHDSSPLSNSPTTIPNTLLVPNSPIPPLLTSHLPIHSTSTSDNPPHSPNIAPMSDATAVSDATATSQTPALSPDIAEPSLHLPNPISVNTNTSHHPMQTRSKSGIHKPKQGYAAQVDYTVTKPSSYKIAAQHSQWCIAMQDEFDALQKQGTWSLVPPPPHKNIVGCKWVYKLKRHSDGTIARYKARLVAKGFHQQQGVDYDETFSPVVKPPTVRLILSLAVSLNWPLRQLDVKNAFLHGTLKEEAPRAWFDSFTTQLLHLGFTASTADSSLFIYHHKGVIAYLLLYVDDIVLTSNSTPFLDHLVLQLSQVFDIKDLGTLHYFLGIQVTRTPENLLLTQTKYASDLLIKHHMVDSKPAKTPCSPNTRLSLHEGDILSDPHGYRSLVGALHYLTFTRPDISFAVHQVCQYMSTPTSTHLTAAKRILRYIKGTLHHGIAFTPGSLSLSVYSDADWAGDPDDRRSTSGMLIYLGSNPITWSAKKQPTVSRSSTESEYRALATASVEVCWIRTLLKDLAIYLSQPPVLWCDNVSALAIASNPVFHARTKHIEVDFHFIRERVLRKDLVVKFVSTTDQLADIFTKSLPTHHFLDLCRNLTVSLKHHSIEGE
uniref:Integrase catalytic domain-containing protein n=1 Tax=Fagus sylvatica TaxID=28930 RepID=A0A2N9J6E2_FAGSY